MSPSRRAGPGHSPAPSRRGLPVLVALHGRTGSHTDAYCKLHLDEVLAHLVERGAAPFAIASVDGGDHDYWHPRRDTDPAGMVAHEFLPLLAAHGLDTRRPGFLGWSMGGYGALYPATVLGAARCGVAIAASAAIWHRADRAGRTRLRRRAPLTGGPATPRRRPRGSRR